ncbi:WXG100 family type VII secretion target [Nocardioides sp. BE266]|uniref:WXG100 family type VII secretion target n=1 Tax=Nocardioides sp. BE266 TaxID=2817725 RepID=UPI0028610930|nr:WXG100 family type VII secretion target [Nocardioides sp. BE266]MDR7253457.1 WXG100 family type VII secretion target [Nocardioides sp. BE266]
MADVDSFSLDPDELDAVIGDLERTEAALNTITSDLETQMRALHDEWEGLAAQAHSEAHAQWTAGMVAMRQAMSDLRAAARAAHGNYTAAGDANLAMWRSLQ